MDELNSFFFSGSTKPWRVISSSKQKSIPSGTAVSFPVGYQAGDTILAIHVVASSTAVPTAPAGWTLAASSASSSAVYGITVACHFLPKVTSETSYTFTNTNSTSWYLVLVAIRPPAGFDQVTGLYFSLIDKFATADGVSSSNDVNPAPITTELDNNLIFIVGAQAGNGFGVPSAPAGYTSVISEGASSPSFLVACKQQDKAGIEDPGAINISAGSTLFDIATSITFAVRSKIYPFKISLPDSDWPSQSTIYPGTVVASGVSKAVRYETDGTFPVEAVITGGNATQYRLNAIDPWIDAGTFVVANTDSIGLRQTAIAASTKGSSATTTASVYFRCGTQVTPTYTYSLTTNRFHVQISSSSNTSWIVPAGVTSLTAIGTGTGGSGGTAYNTSTVFIGSGGGGGGALSYTETLPVTAGETLTLRVYPLTATNGGNTMIWRSTTPLFKAQGGLGGGNATSTAPGLGGAGGSATNGIGTVRYSGGAGGNGVISSTLDYASGGGGGAGGYSAAGGNGAIGSTTGTSRVSSAAASGGAASGGASGCGGGGTGVSGAGTSGAASGGGGREGSPDVNATDGTIPSSADWGDAGGTSGGGGSGGIYISGYGGPGRLRLTW